MSDEDVEVPTTFKKRNIRNKGGRKRKESSSEEKNSSDSDQGVILPTKRPQKANPNIQSTSGPKKQKIEDDVVESSDDEKPKERTTLSVQQQRENATATYELDTERDRDAQAIFEKAQIINSELEGQADDKVYRGINNYAQYYKKKDTAAGNASSGLVRKGPIRAPANLRATVRTQATQPVPTTRTSTRTKASSAQLTTLAEHMQAHPAMAAGISNTLQGRANMEVHWKSLAAKLNSMGGTIKPVAKWKQAWRDMRNNVKKKASHNAKEHRGYGPNSTGHGPSTLKDFSEVDEKVPSVMGPVAVYEMEDVLCTEPSYILGDDVATKPEPVADPLQEPSVPEPEPLPEPVNQRAQPASRKRRRVAPQIDNFDERLLKMEEQKLKIAREKNSILREKNEILNRLVGALQEISNKMK